MMFFKRLVWVAAIIACGLFAAQANAAQSKIETRIVGGTESTSGQWPWMVALSFYGASSSALDASCGATLVHQGWVMTAAHCVYDITTGAVIAPAALRAYVGAYDLAVSPGITREVSRIIVHPKYDAITSDNDIALLKLSSSVTTISPINLITDTVATSLQDVVNDGGNDVSVIGWGATQADPNYPIVLRDVSLQYVSNTVCDTSLVGGQITDNMLCAGIISGGLDSCQGDSGGPLVFYNGNQWYQAGIVSWGLGCAEVNSYGVYSRVNNYTHWIDLIVNGYQITPEVQFGHWLPALTTTAKVSINNFAGIAPLGIDSISTNNSAYSVINDGCSPVVNIGAACDVTVEFVAGVTTGEVPGSLVINTDDLSVPQITVALKAEVVTRSYFNLVSASDEILWALGGDNSWVERVVTTGGTNSLQSGETVNTQNSSLFAYVTVGTSGTRKIYFDWKVCSEAGYDFLELWLDNTKIDAISGDVAGGVNWVNKSITIDGAGDHVIEWRYKKDYLATFGSDVGWLDNISLDNASTSLGPLPVHAQACDSAVQKAEEPVPSIVAYVPPSGGGVSMWLSLGFGLPLLMRRRNKFQ